MKTIIAQIIYLLGPIIYKAFYKRKEDFYRYALNALEAKASMIFWVLLRKLNIPVDKEKFQVNGVINEFPIDISQFERAGSDSSKEIPKIFPKNIVVIDQSKAIYTVSACVPTSIWLNAMRTLSIVGVEATYEDYLLFLNHCEDRKIWDPKSGAITIEIAQEAEGYFLDKYPKFPMRLHTEVFDNTKDFMKFLEKGYTATLTYKNNSNYAKDKWDNRVIDSDGYSGRSIWGHCVRGISGEHFFKDTIQVLDKKGLREFTSNQIIGVQDSDTVILDNYPDRDKFVNFYVHNRLNAHMKNWLFSRYVFTFIPLFEIPKDFQKSLKAYNIQISPEIYEKSLAWIKVLETELLPEKFYSTQLTKLSKENRIAFDIASQYQAGLLQNFNIENYK